MSILDVGIEQGFRLPESPEQLVLDNPELSDFLNNLDRPIGLIKPECATEYAISAEITDRQREVLRSIGHVAALKSAEQNHLYGINLTSGFTEFDDRRFSRIGHSLDDFGHHGVDNLIIVEDRFVFAHGHVFRRMFRPDGILQVEGNIAPITTIGLDSFNVLHHRWQYRQQLNSNLR